MQRVCGRLAPDLLQRVGEPRALVDGGRLRALVPRLLVHERHHHHLARIGALPSRRAPRVKHSPNSNPSPTCMSILITISRASEPCRRGAREHERARNLTRPTHTAARAARCPSWHPSGSCAPLPAKARARCQCCRARAAAPACCTSACPHLSTSGARRGGGDEGGGPAARLKVLAVDALAVVGAVDGRLEALAVLLQAAALLAVAALVVPRRGRRAGALLHAALPAPARSAARQQQRGQQPRETGARRAAPPKAAERRPPPAARPARPLSRWHSSGTPILPPSLARFLTPTNARMTMNEWQPCIR